MLWDSASWGNVAMALIVLCGSISISITGPPSVNCACPQRVVLYMVAISGSTQMRLPKGIGVATCIIYYIIFRLPYFFLIAAHPL